MIWLTWRQHRKQAMFTVIGLAVLAALLIPTGLAMHHAFQREGLTDCVRNLGHAEMIPATNDYCNSVFRQFNSQFKTLGSVGILLIFLPLLVGLFWGAPLVAREIEHGTHRLVWTQGISRRHWALVKIGMVGAAVLTVATIYGLGMSWWLSPQSQAGDGRFSGLAFDVQGLTPIGYTLFAVALGIFAGTIWHKVLPAMAATLAGFTGTRIALTVLARPHYLPARTLTYPVDANIEPNQTLGNWIQAVGIRDPTGKLIIRNVQAVCAPNAPSCGGGFPLGAYNWQLYQPADRFWLFQSIETGIYVALAALLLYLAIRRLRRIA